MPTVHNTVFISYRRETSSYVARAMFMDLREHGYDVFMDVENIDAGQFEGIILRQIAARAHFLLILTPNTLERAAEPGDWLKREFEEAHRLHRNIVPILANEFRFQDVDLSSDEGLAQILTYNSLLLPHEYFDCAMERLRTRFLAKPRDIEIFPISPREQRIVEKQLQVVAAEPKPDENILMAEKFFNQANIDFDNGNYIDAIYHYQRAIEHNANYLDALVNQGSAFYEIKAYNKALECYARAIELAPEDSDIYCRRGYIRAEVKEYTGALEDYSAAIRLAPHQSFAYIQRGVLYSDSKDYQKAIDDYSYAMQLERENSNLYFFRARAYQSLGELHKALADFEMCLQINPNDESANKNRENILQKLTP